MNYEIFTIQQENQLDEMQEQTMRKIESHGFWLLWGSFWRRGSCRRCSGLRTSAGEWVVFMIGCIYTGVACLRNGLWDRHFSDTPPANAVWSLVAAVAVTLIIGFPVDTGRCRFYRCFYRHPVLCIAAAVRRIDTQTARASG